MNKYLVIVLLGIGVTMAVAVAIPLRYSQATLLFGLVGLCLAPLAIHKIESAGLAGGLLLAVSFFASYPLIKLLNFQGTSMKYAVQAAYIAIFFVAGLGWRRSWKNE